MGGIREEGGERGGWVAHISSVNRTVFPGLVFCSLHHTVFSSGLRAGFTRVGATASSLAPARALYSHSARTIIIQPQPRHSTCDRWRTSFCIIISHASSGRYAIPNPGAPLDRDTNISSSCDTDCLHDGQKVQAAPPPLPLLASSGPSPHSSGVQTGEGKGGRRGEGGRGAGRRGGAGVGIVRQVQGRSSACLSVYHGVSPRPLPSNTRCNIRPRPRLHESMKLKRLGDC